MNFSGAENVPLLGLFWYISCTGSGTEKQIPKNGTMMYRNSPRLGTMIVPKRKGQAISTFVYQYAPKIDPNLGGNRYMEWFTFERKRYGTLVYSCKHCLQKSANILTALLTALRLPLKRPPDVPAGALKQAELVTSAM